jgi:hypothetical protein
VTAVGVLTAALAPLVSLLLADDDPLESLDPDDALDALPDDPLPDDPLPDDPLPDEPLVLPASDFEAV